MISPSDLICPGCPHGKHGKVCRAVVTVAPGRMRQCTCRVNSHEEVTA